MCLTSTFRTFGMCFGIGIWISVGFSWDISFVVEILVEILVARAHQLEQQMVDMEVSCTGGTGQSSSH